MEWFVIKENGHVGPYDLDTLNSMHESQAIESESFIWKEGMESPIAYGVLFLKEEEEDQQEGGHEEYENELPPAIPVDAFKIVEQKRVVPQKVEQQKIEQQKIEQKKVERGKVDEASSKEEPIEHFFTETVPPRFKKYFIFIGVSLLSLAVLVCAVLFLLSSSINDFSRPSTMRSADYDRLIASAQTFDGQAHFSFALSPDRSKIWMSVNSYLQGRVTLRLKSVPDKLLGTNTLVHVESTSELVNQLAVFDKFEFKGGARLVDGYYLVEVSASDELNQPLLRKDLLWRLDTPFSKDPFHFQEEVFISSIELDRFTRLLEEQSKQQASNEQRFLVELQEKYQTLSAMIVMIRESFAQLALDETSRPHEILAQFEAEYREKFGRYFTEFVIQNDGEYDDLVQQDFENKHVVLAEFSQLSRFAKKIGALSMESLKKLEKLANSGDQTRTHTHEVHDEILNRFDDLASQAQDRVEKLMLN